jgi:hypothetical protein
MRPPPASPNAVPGQRLMAAVRQLLGASMGGEPRLVALRAHGRPLAQALRLLILYALVWAGAEALALAMARPTHPQSVAVLAWFGCLLFIRAWIARHTTVHLTQTIEQDILPYASSGFLESVAAEIERRNSRVRRIVWPLLAAGACAVAALVAFTFDLKNDAGLPLDLKDKTTLAFTSPQSWFGILLMVYGFFLSARSAGAAGFYIAFAERLEIEPSDGFFVLGAADSPLVQGLAKLGSQVLIFWAVIFLAILSSVLLALPWLGDHGLGQASKFVMLFVPLAGFITLGMGSLVYLRSEAKIRAALRSFTENQAAVLQERMNTLLDPLAGRIPHDEAEIARLTEWHDRILAGGRYGSRVGTAVSIALPLLLPAVSFVWSVVERLLRTG